LVQRWVVAVDGPSGSGKSTVSRRLAAALDSAYLDTGAMYRAVTWAVLRAGVDPTDADGAAKVAAEAELEVGTSPDHPYIRVDGTDVDGPIRGPEVTGAVSAVAAVPAVRRALVARQLVPDIVFGPAYKGIPIAVATAVALATRHGIDVGVTFNRKEAKAHGEGGHLIGRPLAGRVVVVDDVMTAGTAARQAAALVASGDATLGGIVVALDRQERQESGDTAVQEIARTLAVPVISIISLQDVLAYLDGRPGFETPLEAIRRYQREHCLS
jgi:orotate phosphoribosyltransferase